MGLLAIVAAMRKLVSLAISLTILMVSSLPLVPLASACPPAHASAMQVMDEMQMHQEGQHPAMHAAAHIDVDAGQACIECACGCHNSIDSLPHVLAPHSPDNASRSCVLAFERAAAPTVNLRPEARILNGFSPPPQFV